MADTETVKKTKTEKVEETPKEEVIEKVEEVTEEEEFDKERAMATIKKLRGFEKSAGKLQKQIDAFKEKEAENEKAKLSEIDRLKLDLTEVSQKHADLLLDTQRKEAARAAGLPDILVDRIKGKTPEEMEEDAQLLMSEIPTQKSKISTMNPGKKGTEQKETKEQQYSRIMS